MSSRFLSTPSARRATSSRDFLYSSMSISIHALREEGDDHPGLFSRGVDISIHALREEGDSTPPVRSFVQGDFYPRPPRGGRPDTERNTLNGGNISIHALREEGDLRKKAYNIIRRKFLSTPSARRATICPVVVSYLLVRFLSTPSARRAT